MNFWEPKDVVGGDIYFFEKLNEDECLIFVIDCAGHGVPGALMTSLVKAIQRNIMNHLSSMKQEISPGKILSIFNKDIKNTLQQQNKTAKSNSGFDGSIIFFNKKTKLLRFSGAHSALFLLKEGAIETIKGNRHSVGYRSSDSNFEFQDHERILKEKESIFLFTDGITDQIGEGKELVFGKNRLKK